MSERLEELGVEEDAGAMDGGTPVAPGNGATL